MDELPEPLVPAEVDLRDYDFMPFYGKRLFESETWLLCDADEKVAALRLWWRSWHEEPAGSLPSNDRILADAAGYGVAIKAFLGVKHNAMRGWIRCSDGRLYHPVVASIAIEVWRTKHKKRSENEADRERKKRKRAAMSGGQEPDVRRTSEVIPPENALKGREVEVSDAVASGGSTPPDEPADPIKDLWDRGLAIVGDKRRALLGKMRQQYGDPVVLAAIVACETELPSEPASFFIQCCERAAQRGKGNGHRIDHAARHADGLDTLARAALDFDERQGNRGPFEAAH